MSPKFKKTKEPGFAGMAVPASPKGNPADPLWTLSVPDDDTLTLSRDSRVMKFNLDTAGPLLDRILPPAAYAVTGDGAEYYAHGARIPLTPDQVALLEEAAK